MNRLWVRLLLGCMLGLLVFAALAGFMSDVGDVADQLSTFNWWFFAGALALAFGNYLIRFLKWQYYLGILDLKIPTGESFLVFLSSFMLTVTPGKLGEVLKSGLLKKRRGIAVSRTAPIVVAERLTDLLALLALSVVGITSYRYGVGAFWACLGIVIFGLMFLSSQRAANWVVEIVGKLPLIGRFAPRLSTAYRSIRVLLAPKALFGATALSVVGWSLECIAFALVIQGTGASFPDILTATFVYSFTTVVGALSFLPGGLGVTDASMAVLLTDFGLVAGQGAAVAATVVIRVATLWFAVAVGIISFLIYQNGYGRSRVESDMPAGETESDQPAPAS